MKPKTHLRIVCLRNNQSTKSYLQNQSFSGTTKDKLNAEQETSIVPNLVYLSARIQGVQKNNQSRVISEIAKKIEQNQKEHALMLAQRKETSLRETDEKKLSMRKYFERQKEKSEREKMTIRKMMGSIDFQPDKRQQTKVARHIRKTISKEEANPRHSHKKRNQEELIKTTQNRAFLEEDFKNFLTNKQTEYEHPKVFDISQEENRKVRKLSVINPERQQPKNMKDSARSLNLFNFLGQNQQKRMRSPLKQGIGLRFQQMNSNMRLQKKMMKLALNLKTQEYEFEWKKLQSDKSFNLCSINS